MDTIAVGLVDAAIEAPLAARERLSRELLALSSVLSIARTGGLLSPMNADLIAHEAHLLLQEIAGYEEPRIFMDEAPTLAALAKSSGAPAVRPDSAPVSASAGQGAPAARPNKGQSQGHIKDSAKKSSRRDAVLDVLRAKGPLYIKDISTVIRDVSEKTIQRELATLVAEGLVTRSGERRWTSYALAS
jgi:DNA-binding transcriptional ArsR family regulator